MRVIAGPEKKTRVMSEKERLVTAYHEMGHAMVAHFLENTDPVHKISIISRGQALGYTISLPTEDKFLTTRAELADTLAMTLGGRAAEEITLLRDHDRRRQRPREGHPDREADGDALRHVREARPAHLRPRPVAAVPRPRVLSPAGLQRRDRAGDRRRDPPDRRGGAPDRQGGPDGSRRRGLDRLSRVLLERETIEREEFEQLLAGKTRGRGVRPARAVRARARARRRSPSASRSPSRARCRSRAPGLAGGTAEMRGDGPRRAPSSDRTLDEPPAARPSWAC